MSLNWPKPSMTNVPEYQLSGLPYCVTIDNDAGAPNTKTGVVEFPRATRWIVITASRKPVNIYFVDDLTAQANDNPAAVGTKNAKHNNQFITIKEDTISNRFEIRCRKIYFEQVDDGNAATNVSFLAGLTHIDKNDCIEEHLYDWMK